MERKFTITDGARGSLPVMLGLCGPSRSGKTYSALRLATGMQRVTGGDIVVIDTESSRAKTYGLDRGDKPRAGKFRFRHLALGAPFCPLDYLAAIDAAQKAGARIIIVDSMSHEHEGPGGVLEQHDAEVERLAKAWNQTHAAVQMPAWGAPKAKRRRLINSVQQLGVHLVLCFRSKEKVKILKPAEMRARGTDEKLLDLGWMPIGGEEFIYEMAVRALLLPGAEGTPVWQSEMPGEKEWIGIDEPLRQIFHAKPRALDEEHGEAVAKWAAGADFVAEPHRHADKVKSWVQAIEAAESLEAIEAIAAEARKLAGEMTAKQKQDIAAAKKESEGRLVPAGRMAGED